ncbi:twin-arginine translocase subunit TatC [Paenibacillus xerothermodurans]|uniref:Sec-independent protein translocase protein TatC n=1 Tax=Paenibacillus xerothermodurans TaxID=1977292 RepID=A0A2W1N8K0_PAEXE|nr:twin-arginine translocase subunit TatC [Paenibacillus xerothermodurans]PZE20697.1 twin-arginine translocase subunit TatC [Paenibacillus xerothermodurans]
MADIADTKSPNETVILHLEELRKRIIITLAAFVVTFCASFIFVKDIYRWLVRDVEGKLAILAPSDVIWVYFLLSGVVAIALTMPVLAWQSWLFVKPALKAHEYKATKSLIPALALLFIIGICFGYFIIYPMVYSFLETMAGDFETMYTAEKYFTFMVNMTVPFGILFEMPVVVMFLTQIGVLNPVRMAKIRKLSYFVLAITAVTITPPDIISDILVIIPLFLLYELSVSLSKVIYRRQNHTL